MKNRFYYLLIINGIICNYILFIPYSFMKKVNDGVYTSIFAGFLVSCINCALLIYVFNKFKDLNLVAISELLFGKIFGRIFSAIFITMSLVMAFLYFRGLALITRLYLLPNTNVSTVAVLSLFILFSSLKNSDKTYLQLTGYYTVIIIMWSIIYLVFGISSIDWDYAIGSVIHSTKFLSLSNIAASAFMCNGIYLLALFNPQFKKISFKKTVLIFMLVGIPVMVLMLLIPIGRWGPSAVKNILLNQIITSDTIGIDFFIIERVMFLFIPLFILLAVCNMINFCFTAIGLLKNYKIINKHNVVASFVIGILFVLATVFVVGAGQYFTVGYYWVQIWFVFQLFTSITLFVGAILRRGKSK